MLTNCVQAENTPPPAYASPDEHRPTSSNAPPSEVTSEPRDDPEVTAPIAPPTPVPASNNEIKLEVTGAQAATEGVRQRKTTTPGNAKDTAAQVASAVRPQGTEGVPIQLVAILCLVSFLLAYFFF